MAVTLSLFKNSPIVILPRPLFGGRGVFIALLLLLLNGCASTPIESISREVADNGINLHATKLDKTAAGWRGYSASAINGGTNIGSDCPGLEVFTLAANVETTVSWFKKNCIQDLSSLERKWLNAFIREFRQLMKVSPVAFKIFSDLNAVRFNLVFVDLGVRYVKESEVETQGALPVFTYANTGPDPAGSVVNWQQDATSAMLSILHEYFHTAVSFNGWQFASKSIEETSAYLMEHAAAVDIGSSYAPTPRVYTQIGTMNNWNLPDDDASAASRSAAGAKLAFTFVSKAQQCAHSRAAVRGIGNLLAAKIAKTEIIVISTLRELYDSGCSKWEAAETPAQKARDVEMFRTPTNNASRK